MSLQHIITKKISEAELLDAPVDHLVIDNFLPLEVAQALSREFPQWNDDRWYFYNNPIEYKKASNQ